MTQPARISILADCDLAFRGGSELHIRRVAELLISAGHAVQLVELSNTVHDPLLIPGATHTKVRTARLLSWSGLKSLWAVRRLVSDFKPSCVLSFFESSDICSALLSIGTSCRRFISSRRDTGFRYTKALRCLYPFLNRHFDEIIVPSEAVRHSVLEQGYPPDRILMVRNGVEVPTNASCATKPRARTELDLDPEAYVVLCVAELSPVKDHRTLLEAVAALKGRLPVMLLAAGNGKLAADLSEYASELGIEESVRWLGARSDIPLLLEAADVFALTSTTEGLSNALLEAMGAGKPIVATAVGGNVELVQNGTNGFLVGVGDSQAAATSFAFLHENPAVATEMGARGRQSIMEMFSMQGMLAGYVRAIVGPTGELR